MRKNLRKPPLSFLYILAIVEQGPTKSVVYIPSQPPLGKSVFSFVSGYQLKSTTDNNKFILKELLRGILA